MLKILKLVAKNINYLYNLLHEIKYRQRSDEDGGRDIILYINTKIIHRRGKSFRY